MITGYNLAGTPDLIRALLRSGVDLIRISPYAFSPHHRVDPHLFISKGDHEWLLAQVDQIKAEGDANVDVGLNGYLPDPSTVDPAERARQFASRAACSAGRNGLIVLSDGKVIPCDEMPANDFYVVGDLTIESIRDVWASRAWERIVTPPKGDFSGTSVFGLH